MGLALTIDFFRWKYSILIFASNFATSVRRQKKEKLELGRGHIFSDELTSDPGFRCKQRIYKWNRFPVGERLSSVLIRLSRKIAQLFQEERHLKFKYEKVFIWSFCLRGKKIENKCFDVGVLTSLQVGNTSSENSSDFAVSF